MPRLHCSVNGKVFFAFGLFFSTKEKEVSGDGRKKTVDTYCNDSAMLFTSKNHCVQNPNRKESLINKYYHTQTANTANRSI